MRIIKPKKVLTTSIAALCVAVAAGALGAMREDARANETATAPAAAARANHDLSGRWQGQTYELSRRPGAKACGEDGCQLTLDISHCGTGWCGVEVADAGAGKETCRATALKLDAGVADEGDTVVFRGKLELADGAEPYTVSASVIANAGDTGTETLLSVSGDTGGEYRMFRRSFPFESNLARSGEAHCKPDKTVSLLAPAGAPAKP